MPEGEGRAGWGSCVMAEEVRPELTGHQESPSGVMTRCKWPWEMILTKLCVGPWGRNVGVITGAPRRAFNTRG